MVEGVVQNGVVVLDQPGALPSGTRVRVEQLQPVSSPASDQPTIWEKLRELGKKAELRETNLPSDLAENHDHYLHGLPKRT